MSTQDVLILLYDVLVNVITDLLSCFICLFIVLGAGLFSFMTMIYIHIVDQMINLILMCAD